MFCLSEEYKYRLFETYFDIPAIVCCARIVDVLDEEVYILSMLLFFHYFIKQCSLMTLLHVYFSQLHGLLQCIYRLQHTGIVTQKQTFFLFLFLKKGWREVLCFDMHVHFKN